MTRWARSLLPMVLLPLGACTPTPDEVMTAGSLGSTSELTVGTTPVMTTVATTDPVGTTTSVPTGEVDTTMSVDPTGDGESSSSGPPAPCTDCGSNQTCENDECVDACAGTWGAGRYDYCLTDFGDFDTEALCGVGHTCATWGEPIEQTACALQDCVDACDCPPPPASGNPVVSCGKIPGTDGSANDCYLDCGKGELCPDGMACNSSGVCVTSVPELPVYGDCENLAASCEAPGFCYDAGGRSVCTMGCTFATDCPNAYPPGGSAVVTCTDIDPGILGFECYLSCVGPLSCPDGMNCVNGTLCMWLD